MTHIRSRRAAAAILVAAVLSAACAPRTVRVTVYRTADIATQFIQIVREAQRSVIVAEQLGVVPIDQARQVVEASRAVFVKGEDLADVLDGVQRAIGRGEDPDPASLQQARALLRELGPLVPQILTPIGDAATRTRIGQLVSEATRLLLTMMEFLPADPAPAPVVR